MRNSILNLCAAFSVLILFSAFSYGNYTLILKSGNKTLPEGQIESGLKGKTVNGKMYRLMQFYAIPSDAKKAEMEKLGVTFFGYWPKNTFLVSLPQNISAVKLSQYNIRSIAKVSADMKLSKNLTENNVPYWAQLGDGKLGLVVAFMPGISADEIDRILTEKDISFTKNNHEGYRRIEVNAHRISELSQMETVLFIQEDEAPGEPENFRARTDHRVNAIQNSNGMNYDGTGVKVAVGDDGDIGPHIDYSGRLISYAGPSNGDHGDHVAGTVFGAGNVDPRGKGMAPGAEVAYFDYSSGGIYLIYGDTIYTQLGVPITQSSYSNGLNAGYTGLTQQLDEQAYDYKGLLHVFSSGNSGTSNGGWYNVTGGHKVGKNVIATGNLLWNDQLATSSSRGPAHDGRIKPDVCAVGTQVYSTIDGNTYGLKTGTSMASPGVSGVLATLYQAYMDNNNGDMPYGGLMKAILMNNAEDIGNPGPDFKHGYGRINALRAAETIEEGNWSEHTIAQNQGDTITFAVPTNIAELKVMVHWTDPEASINTNRALVNDINATLYNGSFSQSYQPWVLDNSSTSTLNNNAVRGTDSLNNTEQMTISNPASGDYHVVIDGHAIPQGPQRYFVTYTFIKDEIKITHPNGGEHFDPTENEIIRWDAPDASGTFTIEYSTNNGSTFTNISSNVSSNQDYYEWNVPNTVTGEALIRISRGAQSDVSDNPFSIVGTPSNLNVVWSCPDSLLLTWNAVTGATGYEISKLGNKYMDSIDFSSTNSIVLKNINPTITNWFAVRALAPNGCVGERSIALEKQPGTFGCNIQTDAVLQAVVSPKNLPTCQNLTNIEVTVELSNSGQQDVYDIPLVYQLQGNPAISDTLKDTIAPGAIVPFTFTTPVSFAGSGIQNLIIYTELQGDQNKYNDTIHHEVNVFSSVLQSVPYSENFDSFSSCSTQNNCEATICNLSNGWKNSDNLVDDDVDFRTDNGGTPSSGTGPNTDHTTNTVSGNYLYLEASGGCDGKVASLISPCFDLTNINSPEAKIWYHMDGSNMGELHVDILSEGVWIMDIVTPISGNQGSNWQQLNINLLPYVGKTVNLRFRGITGNGYLSDLALDDFEIIDLAGPPVAQFTATDSVPCVNNSITLTDLSFPAATSWTWSISPSTFSFVGGSNANSQSPEVVFSANNLYTVKLVVSNSFGTDSVTHVNFIDVNSGQFPIIEDFENAIPPASWEILNPDGATTWSNSGSITGSAGISTNAIYMDNFNYNSNGALDYLIMPRIDLDTISNAILVFDVAYARYSAQYSDGLRIDISTDCGQNFTPTSYLKQGTTLATVPDQTGKFTPGSALHWRSDTLDLSTYSGNSIELRFTSLSNYGNSLYLDNVNLIQNGIVAPVSAFTATTDSTCTGQTVTFTSTSTGAINSYQWNFGSGASPATATTAGPHQVVYNTTGTKNISLLVGNNGGQNTTTQQLLAQARPVADFASVNADTLTVDFTDLSANSPTAWEWKFGDGNTSNAQNPSHTYAAGGTYTVELKASNNCGDSDTTFAVYVSDIGINERSRNLKLSIAPNPAQNFVTLNISAAFEQDLEVKIADVSGKSILNKTWKNASKTNDLHIDLGNIAAGIYVVQVSGNNGVIVKRLVVRK